jgi:hypothetical protein
MDKKFEMQIKDDPDKDKISCPKCGFKQDPAEECLKCGIIFKKLVKNSPEAGINATKQLKAPADPMLAKVQAETMFYRMGNSAPSVSYAQVFRWVRISILFLLLMIVGIYTSVTSARMTNWKEPRRVVIYPINADGSEDVYDYINALEKDAFNPIEKFMRKQAGYYELGLSDPILIDVAPEVKSLPPVPPEAKNLFHIMLWSLEFRYWAYKNNTYDGQSDIRIFVLYRNNATYESVVEKSLGLKKGFIALVHSPAAADAQPYTNFIIAHEMLHTFGAKDKYDGNTLLPKYPEGFAEPDANPLYPQEKAEIMAGNIPVSDKICKKVKSLDQVVIGEATAREIKWLGKDEYMTKE